MCLKHHSTSTNHLSSLAALVAWRADLIKPTMRSRQGVCLRQGALTSRSPGSIHINHQPLVSHPIEQAARGGKRLAGEQVLLKKRSQGFYGRLIKGSEKAGERGGFFRRLDDLRKKGYVSPRVSC
jgi:hypothetical protein